MGNEHEFDVLFSLQLLQLLPTSLNIFLKEMPEETETVEDVTLEETEENESSISVSGEEVGGTATSDEDVVVNSEEEENSAENPELIESDEAEIEQTDTEILSVPAPTLTMDEEWDNIMQLNQRLIKE